MATFVLVHGAWHGGWCWKKVVPLLRAAGHDVYTPTLTGLGERAHLLSPTVNLSMHITDIANMLFYEDLWDVLLVGHSYGGLVIDGVAETEHSRIRHLVYLDAVLAVDGQSLFDTELIDDPEMRTRWMAGAANINDTVTFPGSSTIVDRYLNAWSITDPADVAWVKPRFSPHPIASAAEPLRAPTRRASRLPSAFIYCAGSSDSPPAPSAHATEARARGYDYYEISTEHDAMVTAPIELATLLLHIAMSSEALQT